MSNFSNAVYIPTGLAAGEEFIKISGYCYKRVSSGTSLAGETVSNFVTGFDTCLDCNTCNCPKTINFYIGGITHNISESTFAFTEKQFDIKTSSTGWQEIAIESGHLNNSDSNLQFKPLSIRCYDRKIDIQSGIYASFNSPSSHIAHFQYSSGQDLYERRDLVNAINTGEFGDVPAWDYINQYDNAVSYQNTLNTIKFKSLCEVPCSQYDVDFRMRGLVKESIRKHLVDSNPVSSWVYVTCSGVPRTPGQIVNYDFGADGYSYNQYYNVPEDASQPTLEFQTQSIELVNMDLLTGNTNDPVAQFYSASGGRHYFTFKGGMGQGRGFVYNGYTYDFYDIDTYPDPDYHGSGELIDRGISDLGIHYSKLPGCNNTGVQHFKSEGAYGASATPTSGCFETSEFLDGNLKVGTYRPMMFTGMISGNSDEYAQVYNLGNPDGVGAWSSGVYVFQLFPSGNDSKLSNISGYAGNIDELSSLSLLDQYKKEITNSLPINSDNPLFRWNGRSGNFPIAGSSLVKGSVIVEFNGDKTYDVLFQTAERATINGVEKIFEPYATGFRFGSGAYAGYYKTQDNDTYYIGSDVASPPLLDMANHIPITIDSTLVKPHLNIERFNLLDSGNSLHNPTTSLSDNLADDPVDQFTSKIQSITFQVPFDI